MQCRLVVAIQAEVLVLVVLACAQQRLFRFTSVELSHTDQMLHGSERAIDRTTDTSMLSSDTGHTTA